MKHRLKHLSVIVIGATAVVIATVLLSDSEFVRIVKEVIFLLVKAGYEAQKIIQIINLYQ